MVVGLYTAGNKERVGQAEVPRKRRSPPRGYTRSTSAPRGGEEHPELQAGVFVEMRAAGSGGGARYERHSQITGAGCARPTSWRLAPSGRPWVGASTLARIRGRYRSLSPGHGGGAYRLAGAMAMRSSSSRKRGNTGARPGSHELGAYAWRRRGAAVPGLPVLGDEDIRADCLDSNPPRLLVRPRKPRLGGAPRGVVRFARADESGLDLAPPLRRCFARAGVEVVSGGGGASTPTAHEARRFGGRGRSWRCWGAGSTSFPPEKPHPLFERLATGGGAVVSEIPPARARARNFPRRNRIVAGLSDAVVVVRAALRSGALLTAASGARGTKVLRRPGEPSNWRAEGSNALCGTGQCANGTGPDSTVLTDWAAQFPRSCFRRCYTERVRRASYPGEPVSTESHRGRCGGR